MKTICFQAKQIGSTVHRIDVKFQVVPTSCTSQLSLGVIIIIVVWNILKPNNLTNKLVQRMFWYYKITYILIAIKSAVLKVKSNLFCLEYY